jgi:hypothetical protein
MKVIPSFFKVLLRLIPISLVTMLMTPTRMVLKIDMRPLITVVLMFPMVLSTMAAIYKSALLIFNLIVSSTIVIVASKSI